MPIKTELLTLNECCDLLGMTKNSFLYKYEKHLSEYIKNGNVIYYDKNEIIFTFKELTGLDFLELKLTDSYIQLYKNLNPSDLNYLGTENLIKEFIVDEFSPALNKLIPTIYALIHKEKIVYIGRTLNVYLRMREHLNGIKEFDKIHLLTYDDYSTFNEAEQLLISKLKPKYNKHFKPYKNNIIDNQLFTE